MIKKNKPFVIAEVGQNHQGDVKIAKKYVEIFAAEGADCIKLQMRNNKKLFTEAAYNQVYNSENSFANIYGHHREKLELSLSEMIEIKNHCTKHNVNFMVTPFDEDSLNNLIDIDVDLLKIASFDLGNLPFIDKIGKVGKPVVLSVGGGKEDQIKSSIETLEKYNCQIIILHCVSEYPCSYDKLGLNNIEILKKMFSNHIVGLSDHFNGILSGPIAYLKGAKVFEKHVTLNRSWKGTDHSFALEREGFRKFVRDINRVDSMLVSKSEEELGSEPVFKKLGKSLISAIDISEGDYFTLDNLSGAIDIKSYQPVRTSNLFIGKRSNRNILKGEFLSLNDIKK